MISSPSSVSTLLCLSVESKTEAMATFEPQINHQIIRKRPAQITKEKSQDATGFGLYNQHQLNKTVNGLVRTLNAEETILVVQQLEKLIQKLNETMQSTISFKPFWMDEICSNEKINGVLDSLMQLIGLSSHDGLYFSDDVEELIKKTLVTKELVQVFQKYYSPTNLEAFKSNLVHCFNTNEIPNKGYMALKLKNMNDMLEDMKINITDKNVSLTRGPTTLSGDFNLIYCQQKQDNDMSGFVDKIISKVRKGENIMLLSVGATGSGKSETFFKGIVSKRDQSEKPDEAIVLQMFERLIDQEAQTNKDSSIVHFECQYLQIFNEITFDLLKKKEEKEDLHEESKQTNMQWLKASSENCTKIEITDKNSIRNIMKRVSKNRALLTVQDKIFERRSTYLLKCQYKVMINDEQKEAEIIFCELPGIEKLTQYEKESLSRMSLSDSIFTSKTEFVDFWTKSYPVKKNSVLMKVLDPNFLRSCQMMIVSHVSLNREAFEETVTLFRLLKNFNETISVHKQSKDQISTDKDILSLLKKFEEIRALLATHYSSSFSVQKATNYSKSIESLQETIMSKCLRLSPAQLQYALKKIPELSNISKLLEARPKEIPKAALKEAKKKVPHSLNEIANISDTKRTTNQVIKSLSSPIGFQKNDNSKRKLAITQDPLYKYIDELVETDLDLYKEKLGTEGRCAVCTLKNCQRHSKPILKEEGEKVEHLASRPQELAIKANSRLISLSRPKEYNYDSENINPTPVKGGMQPYNPPCSAKRRFRRTGSLQCEPVVVRDRNLDKSCNESETKAKGLVNQSMVGSLLEDQENCDKTRIEDMSGPKLAKQLKLEEYHEKKILENIKALREKRIVEESQKRETEMQEEKKKKYFDSQKKKLEEMRKLKVEEKKREKEEIEQRELEEMKKKKKVNQYYKNIKEKVMGYKQKKLAEILHAAEEMTQHLEQTEEEYESIFCGKKEELKSEPVEIVTKQVPSCKGSAQKEIQEEILESPKHNESVEILEEEILEESITA